VAGQRPVWVAGSTHPGEESIVLRAHRQLLARAPRALLILAPRHAPRFDAAAAAIAEQGFRCARRSRMASYDAAPGEADTPVEVLLLDTLGELLEFYAAADLAFVGGSLIAVGGHNLLEPAALGLPVIAGPHQFNSPDVAWVLAQRGALITVHDAQELSQAVARLLADADLRARLGDAARAAIDSHRGALARLLRVIDSVWPHAARA
jgi:3-deoxy-D-manno-octulosonic-acid transferase